MTYLLLALVLQFPPKGLPKPVETCTVTGLKLSTKAMTQPEAWTLAHAKWKLDTRQWWNGNTVILGYRTTAWGITKEPDPRNCLSPLCYRNTNGSWRSLWNAILIDECKRRQQ